MNNMKVLLIKFVTCLIAYTVALDLFFDARWTDIVWFSGLTTIVSYLAGDRILLPRIGNMNALIADFLLSYTLVWIFGSVVFGNVMQIAWGSIISSVIITVGEFFVHRIVLRTMPDESRNRSGAPGRLAYAMEAAEENEPVKKR
ncbi:MAG TPA: YndM family protein [Bacillus bacterium]|nr:YndM family protein [Bacillus sp. (in: firmicutes)]